MRRTVFWVLGSLLLFSVSAPAPAAQAKRAYEIADFYRTATVSPPEVSPDGSRVAFSVWRYDLAANESWSEIWMMAPDGSNQRRMTFGRHSDADPRFSPDGRTLLFTSDRSGETQIHLLSLDGGESRQLTTFPLGLGSPLWSPDGRFIAATSRVYPECGADPKCNGDLAKDTGEGKLQVHIADELLFRHWTEWHDGRAGHILLVDAKTGSVVKDLTPGPWESPTFSTGGTAGGFDFSPDGKQLCYVSNRDPDQALSTNSDLWVVDVDAQIDEKSAVNLTDGNDGWDGSPLYSPDGRWIAYRSQETPRYESGLYRLVLYDRRAKRTVSLTNGKNFDNWVEDVAWMPDSQSLLFEATVEGRTPLYRIGIDGRGLQKVHTHATIEGYDLTPDGKTILYSRRGISEPWEILRVDADGGEPQRLTRFNAALEEKVDIRPFEEMWIDVGGSKIHTFVVKPHGFQPGRKYPLILNVHGGPQGNFGDSYRGDWQVYPGKGYVVAFPNPTGSTGYGQKLIDDIACDWGGRIFQELMQVTDALEKLPYVDAGRMGAMGWSYGGYMMMWFEGHTDRFKTLASMMGMFDLPSFYYATEELWFPEKDLCGPPWKSDAYEKWSPSRAVENFKTPALVIAGELDFRVPYTQSLSFFTALRRQGVPARLIVYPDAGHWPGWREMFFYYNAHLDWFHRWLGGEPAPYDVRELARNRALLVKEDTPEENRLPEGPQPR